MMADGQFEHVVSGWMIKNLRAAPGREFLNVSAGELVHEDVGTLFRTVRAAEIFAEEWGLTVGVDCQIVKSEF